MTTVSWACGLALILAGVAGAAETGRREDWPLADQVRSLASIRQLTADYDARSGPLRAVIKVRVDGDSFRYESMPKTSTSAKPGPHFSVSGTQVFEHQPFPGFINAWTRERGGWFDAASGRLVVFRPKSAAGGRLDRIIPEDTPLPMAPLAFLDFKDHEPSLRTRLAWSDLAAEADLLQRWKDRITGTASVDGAIVATMRLRTPSEDPQRLTEIGFFGDELRIRIRPYAEHDGLRLIEQISMVHAPDGRILGVRTFHYRAIRVGKTAKTVPVLAGMKLFGQDRKTAFYEYTATTLEVGTPVPASSFTIDPTLAKTIYDADTRLFIEPETAPSDSAGTPAAKP